MRIPVNFIWTVINKVKQILMFWSLKKQILFLIPVDYNIFQLSIVKFTNSKVLAKTQVLQIEILTILSREIYQSTGSRSIITEICSHYDLAEILLNLMLNINQSTLFCKGR